MRTSGQSRTGAVLTIVTAMLAVGIGLFVVMSGLVSWKVSSVERRWAATLGSKDEILRRYPPADADPVALELERLAVDIGILMAPHHALRPVPPIPVATHVFTKEVKLGLAVYFRDSIERTRRAIDPPPAALRAFLVSHAAPLEAIRAHLGRGSVPRWEMHIERGAEAPIPNLLGHIDLQKVLVADALFRTSEGDHATAERDLEAAWTLMGGLVDSPILISQLIAVTDARLIAGALRQLEGLPPVWLGRLREHDSRRSFTSALKYEGWHWTQVGGVSEYTGMGGVAARVLASVGRPYFKYCLADASDEFRRRLENLDGVAAICDYDLASHDASLEIPIPRWNLVGKVVVPHLDSALDRLARLEIDFELTVLLLELDAAPAWPASLPGAGASSACPRDTWTYAVAADGSATVALSREVDWGPDVKGTRLPTRFTLPPKQESAATAGSDPVPR